MTAKNMFLPVKRDHSVNIYSRISLSYEGVSEQSECSEAECCGAKYSEVERCGASERYERPSGR